MWDEKLMKNIENSGQKVDFLQIVREKWSRWEMDEKIEWIRFLPQGSKEVIKKLAPPLQVFKIFL